MSAAGSSRGPLTSTLARALWALSESHASTPVLRCAQGCRTGPCCIFVLLEKVVCTLELSSGCAACRGVTRMAKTSGCALLGFVLVKKVLPGAYKSAPGCAACRGVARMAKTSGCALSGFVLVKKVPGTDESVADCVVCRGVTRMAKTSGCALSGFVLVKKVPGALHFLAKSPGHSFDYAAMNMSHVVNYLYFGNKPSPRRHQVCDVMRTLAMRCHHAVLQVWLSVCMSCCVPGDVQRKGSATSMRALLCMEK